MPTHILMNVVDEQELRVAVIRDGRLEALIHERSQDEAQLLGNIYKAKVANVEPSLDAAFLDLGTGKNGFIHVDDLRHDKGRNARIEEILKPGQELVVQITKEAIRDKGPCVSTHISLPGRYLVMMTASERSGVSRRIDDHAARERLRRILDELPAPEGFRLIVRTAGADRDEHEIRLDHEYLTRLWEEIDRRGKRARAPACLYQEADVVLRTLRDLVPVDVDEVIIDEEDLYDEARAFAQVFMPEIAGRITLHRDEQPLFDYYGVEERLAAVFDRRVELPSGGNVVIEQTEALVSIDVNSARNREGVDVAETALRTNLEAVNAIAEQLVLRDLGGLIIIDFIDMESRDHQRLVQLALRHALVRDKARTHVTPMSRFGIIEMTRQRTRPSHKIVSYTECAYCRGTGSVKTAETFEIDCMRAVRAALGHRALSRLEVVVPSDMATSILNGRRKEISRLEEEYDCRISFVGDHLMKAREYRLVSTPRKQVRRRKQPPPVRPALLASLLEERAKSLAEARELIRRGPRALERELESLAQGEPPPAAGRAAPPPAGPASAASTEPWVQARELRRLLFQAPRPVPVAAAAADGPLAPRANGAKQHGPARGRARRRR